MSNVRKLHSGLMYGFILLVLLSCSSSIGADHQSPPTVMLSEVDLEERGEAFRGALEITVVDLHMDVGADGSSYNVSFSVVLTNTTNTDYYIACPVFSAVAPTSNINAIFEIDEKVVWENYSENGKFVSFGDIDFCLLPARSQVSADVEFAVRDVDKAKSSKGIFVSYINSYPGPIIPPFDWMTEEELSEFSLASAEEYLEFYEAHTKLEDINAWVGLIYFETTIEGVSD